VTRIVREDEALVTDATGKEMIVTESYVQLKSGEGEIDFVLLLHKELAFETQPERKVPSLPSLWRKL